MFVMVFIFYLLDEQYIIVYSVKNSCRYECGIDCALEIVPIEHVPQLYNVHEMLTKLGKDDYG